MDAHFIELFKAICQGSAVTAEKVMDANHAAGDVDAFNSAKTMRDNYQRVFDKLDENQPLLKEDVAQIYIGALIMVNGLRGSIEKQQQVLGDYEDVILPKLKAMVDLDDPDSLTEELEKTFKVEN